MDITSLQENNLREGMDNPSQVRKQRQLKIIEWGWLLHLFSKRQLLAQKIRLVGFYMGFEILTCVLVEVLSHLWIF